MVQFLDVPCGRIAYDVAGTGPLVVLSHGMPDTRFAFRFLGPRLVAAGYRVATPDLRGQGESSLDFPTYSHSETADDLIALIRHLGGAPAVLIGHSYSGGATTIVAARAPDLVAAIVELDPFSRNQKLSFPGTARYRKGMRLLLGAVMFRNLRLIMRYLDHAYPGVKPADWADQVARTRAHLSQAGRMKVLQAMGRSTQTQAEASLAHVRCPALIIAGALDPDWANPRAEIEALLAAMPPGIAEAVIIDGAGHYPHVQYPDRVAELILPFLKQHIRE